MKIFTSGLKGLHRFDYVRMVKEILRVIPPEHTAGIAYVTVSGDPPLDDDTDVLGQYYERYEGEPAVIVLYLEVMRRETPRLLRPFSITWKILLAQTLFHEIGHHYQRFSHGIGGPRQEDHAEAYGDRYAREAFPLWYRLIDGFDGWLARWNRLMIGWLRWRLRWRPEARLYFRLGRRYWEEEQWARVVEAWERAVALDPTGTPAREWLPRARVQLARELRRVSLKSAYRRPEHALKRLRAVRRKKAARKGKRRR